MKPERFVGGLAFFAVIGSLLGVFSGVLQLATEASLMKNPETAPLIVESFQERFGMGLTAEQISQMLVRNGALTLALSLVGMVVGVALWRRVWWSRAASIYLLFFLTVGMVSSSIATLGGAAPVPGVSVESLRWASAGLTVLAVVVHAGIIIRLRSPEVRAAFRLR